MFVEEATSGLRFEEYKSRPSTKLDAETARYIARGKALSKADLRLIAQRATRSYSDLARARLDPHNTRKMDDGEWESLGAAAEECIDGWGT